MGDERSGARGAEALGLMLLALALRIPSLDTGLWHDEIRTLVDFGRLPLVELLTTYGNDNNHPLYTLSAWLSLRTFGESAWSLRLPALAFGVASVGVTYGLARELTGRAEARLATLLLALSYHHVWFSQNARGYTALLFFTLASTWVLLRILDGEARPLLYGVLLALGTYAHTTGVFVAMSHGLVALSRARSREGRTLLAGIGAAAALSLALHAPLLAEMIDHLSRERSADGAAEWKSPRWAVEAAARSLGLGLAPGLVALAAATGAIAVGLASYARERPVVPLLFLLPGVIGGGVMIALGRNLWPRFFFFLASFLLLAIVRGMATSADGLARLLPATRREAGRRILFRGGALLAIALFAVVLPRAWQPKQDYLAARDFVDRMRPPGETVMVAGIAERAYVDWLEADYVEVRSPSELRRGYVLYTQPIQLRAARPDLFRALETRGREIRRFRGTVGGGDVVVLRVD